MTREELIRQGEELAKWLLTTSCWNCSDHTYSKHQEHAKTIRSLIALIPKEGEIVHHRELMALEYGYRGCEKGKNLERTMSDFEAMLAAVKR